MGASGEEPEVTRPSRRAFLKGAGVVGLGSAVAGGLSAGPALASERSHKHVVFRLSNRGQRACTACKGHAANRFYRRARFAEHGKAHKGCTCYVLRQLIPAKRFRRYFFTGEGTPRNVFDLRWETVGGVGRE